MKPTLTEDDFKQAAELLNCDVPAIKAVSEVESAGGGFLLDGRPKILFEGHIFHRHTKGIYDRSHPTISYPTWTTRFYIGKEGEYRRLEEAAALDHGAAMMSASWGKFQILGENFVAAGFRTVDDFVAAMQLSEGEHLKAFVHYCDANFIDDELREHRWAEFARRYNGKQYQKNHYDTKLAAAYKKFGGK